MANELDELTGPVNTDGRDINVIEKQLPVKVGKGSKFFEIMLWFLLIIPGLVFLFMKINAGSYLRGLQQRIQHNASQIDNYMEQRVVILENAATIVNKAIDLDKTTMTQIAAYRSGASRSNNNDELRNQMVEKLDSVSSKINFAFENYPELRAHEELQMAMQQNSYLQKEITAAREVYNDSVNQWNRDINIWPTKMIVAAKAGYTTRIPFVISAETKMKARSNFFK